MGAKIEKEVKITWTLPQVGKHYKKEIVQRDIEFIELVKSRE
jgi:hypothetical protein